MEVTVFLFFCVDNIKKNDKIICYKCERSVYSNVIIVGLTNKIDNK